MKARCSLPAFAVLAATFRRRTVCPRIHDMRPEILAARSALALVCSLGLAGCGARGTAETAGLKHCTAATFVAPAGMRRGALYGVDTFGESDVWAVGTDNASGEGAGRSLVLHWDGTTWSRVRSPSPDRDTTALWGVVAVSPEDAWAVGASAKGALIDHWDGHRWHEEQLYLPNRSLWSIDAVAKDDIWAVGMEGDTDDPGPVIEHWDGAHWEKTVTPPAPNAYPYALASVSAIAANDVWAVGAAITDPSSEAATPIVLRWDGTSWRVVPWPMRGDGFLGSVSAVSDTDVWVAGGTGDDDAPLVARWDGRRWSSVAPAGSADAVAASSRAVWIAGANRSETVAAIARRAEGRWLSSRVARSARGWFASVSTLPSGNAWAVGYSDGDGWPLAQRACTS
jgi:hypothetical protein